MDEHIAVAEQRLTEEIQRTKPHTTVHIYTAETLPDFMGGRAARELPLEHLLYYITAVDDERSTFVICPAPAEFIEDIDDTARSFVVRRLLRALDDLLAQ